MLLRSHLIPALTLAIIAVACESGDAVVDAGGHDDAAARHDAAAADARGHDAAAADAASHDATAIDAGALDAAATVDTGAHDAGAASAQFQAIYDRIISPNCGGANCHLTGTNEDNYFGFRASLQMPDAATAYARLVNVQVECMWSQDHRVRVVPSDPVASAILLANQDGLCGRRHNVVVPPSFTAGDLAMIEAWIMAGAP